MAASAANCRSRLPATAEEETAKAACEAQGGVNVAISGGKKKSLAVLPWLVKNPGEGGRRRGREKRNVVPPSLFPHVIWESQ